MFSKLAQVTGFLVLATTFARAAVKPLNPGGVTQTDFSTTPETNVSLAPKTPSPSKPPVTQDVTKNAVPPPKTAVIPPKTAKDPVPAKPTKSGFPDPTPGSGEHSNCFDWKSKGNQTAIMPSLEVSVFFSSALPHFLRVLINFPLPLGYGLRWLGGNHRCTSLLCIRSSLRVGSQSDFYIKFQACGESYDTATQNVVCLWSGSAAKEPVTAGTTPGWLTG